MDLDAGKEVDAARASRKDAADAVVEQGFGPPPRVSGQALRELLADDLWLDELIDRAEQGGVALTGEGGFLPEMIKAVLERGLAAELTSHLGYEVGDPAGRGSPNSRNGSTPKTVQSEVGPLPLDVPRDRLSSFEPRLVPKGQRRLGGLDSFRPSGRRAGLPRLHLVPGRRGRHTARLEVVVSTMTAAALAFRAAGAAPPRARAGRASEQVGRSQVPPDPGRTGADPLLMEE